MAKGSKASKKSGKGALGLAGIVSMICSISFSLVQLAIPIANIVIGSQYLGQCPIETKIPIWLIVSGAANAFVVVGLNLLIILMGVVGSAALLKSAKNATKLVGPMICLAVLFVLFVLFAFLVSIFALIWFIVGNVWVFSKRSTVQYTDSSLDTYCHSTLYLYAFWSIIVTYILLVVSCCCSACTSACAPIVACVTGKGKLDALTKSADGMQPVAQDEEDATDVEMQAAVKNSKGEAATSDKLSQENEETAAAAAGNQQNYDSSDSD